MLQHYQSLSVQHIFVVQYSEQTPTPKDLPNFDAIKETLAKLQ